MPTSTLSLIEWEIRLSMNTAIDLSATQASVGNSFSKVFRDQVFSGEATHIWKLTIDARAPQDMVLERLPNLKLIVSTGPRNASIDGDAARERGVAVMHTGYSSQPTIEM